MFTNMLTDMFSTVTLNDILSTFLWLIPIAVGMRLVILCIKQSFDQDGNYTKRIKNTLIWLVIALCAVGIQTLVLRYIPALNVTYVLK